MPELGLSRSFAGLMAEAQAISTIARAFLSDDPAGPQQSTPPATQSQAPVVAPGALAPTQDAAPPAVLPSVLLAAPAPQPIAQSLVGLRAPFTPGDAGGSTSPASVSDEPPAGEAAGSAPGGSAAAQSTSAAPSPMPATFASSGLPVLSSAQTDASDGATVPQPILLAPAADPDASPSPVTLDTTMAGDLDSAPTSTGAASPSLVGLSDQAVPGSTRVPGLSTDQSLDPATAPLEIIVARTAAGTAPEPSGRAQSASRPASNEPQPASNRSDKPEQTERRDALALHDTALRAEIAVARRDAASNIDVWSADALGQIARGDTTVETGIIPSFILNAAMIPGWPPPKPFEMPTADGLIRLLAKNGPEAEEALLKSLAEHGGASIAARLKKLLARLSRSKRLKILLGLAALMTTIEAAIDAIEAELLELSNFGSHADDTAFDDAFHRRHLRA